MLRASCAGLRRGRRRAGRLVEMAHTAPYYFFGRTRPGARLRHSLRPEQPPDDRLDGKGNGLKLMRRVLQELQISSIPDGQHRCPDGRLVPARTDQSLAGRHQGPEDAHRRLRRQGAQSASARCRRTSPAARSTRRWKGTIDAAEWVTPCDIKLGFKQVAPNYYYPRLVGKAARSRRSSSTTRPSEARRSSTRPSSRAPRPTPTSTCRRATTRAQPGGAEDAGRPGRKLFRFPKRT